jgi:DNA ligase-1
LIDKTYQTRRELLEHEFPQKYLVKRLVTCNHEKAEKMLNEAIKAGHEGLMAKKLDSKYLPGARGKLWFKIKPVENLDVVIKAADWGSGRRRGWLSNYHLAVLENDEYLVTGKTFKGLTDEQFIWITEELKKHKISDNNYTIEVFPSLVLEVAFNEVQKSPKYKSGYALRFARVKRIRVDKSADDINTLDHVKQLYEKQFKYKDKLK